MRITLDNTIRMVLIENRDGDCRCVIPGRVWEGKTDTGIYVQAVITRIAAPSDSDLAQFEAELKSVAAPQPAVEVYPARMIL